VKGTRKEAGSTKDHRESGTVCLVLSADFVYRCVFAGWFVVYTEAENTLARFLWSTARGLKAHPLHW